ncbi:MAG: type II CAAX prenyl endopeptidase Rce1 family protein [Candidatus Methylomirabilales bacterium]
MTQEEIKQSDNYGDHPCTVELVVIIIAGALHVATEILVSPSVAEIYNILVSLCFLMYLVWRAMRSKNVLRVWGMRLDNFWTALRFQLSFGAVGVLLIFAFGMVVGSVSLPATFWLTLGLYPVWGIAQQFALQNLIARNLTGLLSHPLAIACAAAVLFGMAHYPRAPLVFLTVLGGFFFTLIYHKFPNLWAVGIVHGILGAVAFYVVLGEDPGAQIMKIVFG